MSHWAQIDENNIVIQVTVGDNNDPAGDEGYQWLVDNLGGTWIKTSYNGRFRKQYAGMGYKYDETADVFITPKPFPSWTLDGNYDWQPPTPMPEDNKKYYWSEDDLAWKEIPNE